MPAKVKATSETIIPVFVYGSLKKGFSNHGLLRGSQFVKDDAVLGKLYKLGGYPGMVPGTDQICGEVYMVTPDVLQRLDALEGHPTHYKRTDVVTQSGFEAWTYYYQYSVRDSDYIPEGVWKAC